MSEPAIDYSKQLDRARMQDLKPAQFHAPQKADNYDQSQKADNYHTPHRTENHQGSEDHAQRLEEARSASGASSIKEKLDAVKNATAMATPIGAVSLLGQIDFMGDIPFAAALLAAILKDILTLVTIETVIIPIIFSALCTIFIFMMMLLVNGNGKRKLANSLMKRGLVLVGGNIIGSIFPGTETFTVLLIYYMTLVERKNAASQ